MDILRFVNSKDIRKHLADIGYGFTPLEAAWLIYGCRDATIAEKHGAWQELIETMPDCPIEKRKHTLPQESLHAFLRKYMALEDRLVREFIEGDPFDTTFYTFEYVTRYDGSYDFGTVFTRFDALYDESMLPEPDVVTVKCAEIKPDTMDPLQVLYLTPALEPLRLDPGHAVSGEERDLYCGVFDGIWFDFPTPFKKGDILWDPRKPVSEGKHDGPFVNMGVSPDGSESGGLCYGCFLNEDGSLYKAYGSRYTDLEFYDPSLLKGPHRTLVALGSFLQGKIDEVLFAQAYHQLLTVGCASYCMPVGYPTDTLALAGILPKKK